MSIETVTDLEVMCQALAEGKPVDPAVRKRLKERGKKTRQAIFERQGVLNVAVDLIREVRE